MTIESDAKGMFSSEEESNVQIPCVLAATTYELYDNFKQILKLETQKRRETVIQAKPQKIKMYDVLARISEIKPDFIYSMGRLQDHILPPITIVMSLKEWDQLSKKLFEAMKKFLSTTLKSYTKMEKIDQDRFRENYDKVKQMSEEINLIQI